MTKIPLAKKLKKKNHLKLAFAQDLLVSELYDNYPKAIIHGGTAIWRCYNGNRFSEDIDVYLPSINKKKLDNFADKLINNGFKKNKLKITDNAVFSKFSYQGSVVRLEAVEKSIKKYKTEKFEMTDGSFMVVNTLSPSQLIKEKVGAYLGRQKIRDLYDIFFLVEYVKDKKTIQKDLNKLLNKFKPPKDKSDLETLIITGAIPQQKDMIQKIKRWVK